MKVFALSLYAKETLAWEADFWRLEDGRLSLYRGAGIEVVKLPLKYVGVYDDSPVQAPKETAQTGPKTRPKPAKVAAEKASKWG